jgi:adenylosuccinate synthase
MSYALVENLKPYNRVTVLGTQWGDEGKGKIIDLLAPNFDNVARYGGGRNAGHSQVDEEGNELVLHLVPSGIKFPNVYNMIFADVMVDPIGLMEEIRAIRNAGYPVTPSNLGISGRAHVSLQYHKEYEIDWEKRKGGGAVGTTMRMIGPTAVTKFGREGLRLDEFLNPESFELYLKSLVGNQGNIIARLNSDDDVKRYMEIYAEAREFLQPFVVREDEVIRGRKNERWLYEGAQGGLLDVLYGTYPYTTSSTPIHPPSDTDFIIGVMKAYITRVGGGDFPTEMEDCDELTVRGTRGKTPGAEFGATTGRPRKCGWLDILATKFIADVAKVNRNDVTKLDRLTGFPKLKICVDYRYKGSNLGHFPADRFVFEKVEPVYIEVPGWTEDITDAREFRDLPQNARDYLRKVRDLMKKDIGLVSVGPKASQTLFFEG